MQTIGKTAVPTKAQHLTALDQLVLSQAEKSFGKLTSAEALHRAIGIEEIRKNLDAFDLVWVRLSMEQRQLEQYALLIEKASVVGMAQA